VAKFLPALFLFLFLFNISQAQTPDSVPPAKDTVPVQSQAVITTDTVQKDTSSKPAAPKKNIVRIKKDSSVKKEDSIAAKKDSAVLPGSDSTHLRQIISAYIRNTASTFKDVLLANPYFNFLGKPLVATERIHQAHSYDSLFYLMVGMLFYFALIRVFFGKYLSNLFNLFFQVSMRQQQIREQVLQSPLPSLLLNALFVITGGIYGCFLIRYYHLAETVDFWMLLVNCAILLSAVYLVKFLFLKLAGWIFNIQRATDTYIFIIFLVNKILAIFLLPVLVILSFSGPLVTEIMITISLIMVLMFFAYRYIAAYGPIRKEIKVNGFHFFLYLCAFEITPLLLIYKVLLTYLEKAY
jgi:hypothetical protein